MGKPLAGALELPHLASGPTPVAGKSNVFVKSDGKVYVRQPSAAEAALSVEGHGHNYADLSGFVPRGQLPEPLQVFGSQVFDWNTATLTGWYYSEDTAANRPGTGAWYGYTSSAMFSFSLPEDNVTTVVFHATDASQQFQRTRSAGVWGSWQRRRSTEAEQAVLWAAKVHTHAIGDLPVAASGTSNTTQVVRADDSRLSNARTPTAHTHAIGDLPVAASGTSNTTQVVRADDSRLSNARTPTAHTHAVTDMTATGTRSSATYLRGDNTWATPTDTDTTYAEITTAEIDAGTASTLRTITGRRMQYLRDFLLSKAANLSDLANAATARVNLGLGNVDNTSDANKPVSTAQQTALNAKSDTTHNHDSSYATTTHNHDAAYVPLTRTVAGKALSSNVTLVKGDVGLGSVDNTSDAAKPVSTAQQTALNSKADYAVITPLDSWAAPNTYPFGTSMFGVGSTAGTLDTGWPVGAKPCSVVTERASKTAMTGNDYEHVVQRCTARAQGFVTPPTIETYMRTADSSTTWSGWSRLYTEGQMKQPYSKRWKTSNQTIAHSSATTITFGNPTEYDLTYSNNDGWTIQKPGLYLFTVSLDWDRPNTTNRRELRFLVNGVQVALQSQPATALDAQNATQTLTYMNLMIAGDQFRAVAWQNSGVSVNVIGSQTTTFAAVTRLSDMHP